jgi:hypothetical protein
MPQIIPLNLYGVYNGGLNTRDDPRALPIHKSPYLKNVELRRNRVETTTGYTLDAGTDADTLANLGLFVAKYAGSAWEMKAEGGKIKKRKVVGTSPDAAWVTLKSGLTATAKVAFTQANNVVYMTNGTDTVQKWDLATAPATTSDAAGVPKGTTIAYFNQRLVVNDPTDACKLNLSNVGAYETFSAYKYADQGEGGTIQRILDTGRNQLLIMKGQNEGRYLWDGVDTSTSNPKKYSSRGTTSPRSVVMLPSGEVAFCDHEGVWIANIFDYGERGLSDEIDPTWEALNHGKLSDAAAIYVNDKYLLSVTDTGSTTNNLTLDFDFQLDGGAGGWLIHDIPATAWASYVDSNGVLQVIFGDPTANSRVFRRYQGLTSSEFNFNGAAINAVYRTKETDFKEVIPEAAARTKVMLKLNVSAEQKSNYDLVIGWRKDNDTDFLTALWNLLGIATTNWSDTETELWSDSPAAGDVWQGQTKVEGLIPSFKLRGKTLQLQVSINAINQPFTFYGATPYFIPLRGFN